VLHEVKSVSVFAELDYVIDGLGCGILVGRARW
jgi:hypothetical protein